MDTGGRKIGLALSGGAARGLAHIGVIEVLEREGIPIDVIAGTSAGAIIGASYAWDRDVPRIVRDALDANWKKMTPLLDLAFPKTGLLKGQKLRALLASYVGGDTTFADLQIPFACVATDIDTGEEVILNRGSVAEALRASISLPGIFTVVHHRGRYLVDGGLTTPVPIEMARDMGADFIIGVNVNPDVANRLGKTSQKRVEAHKEPNIFQVITQSIYITTYSLASAALASADIVIEPELGYINLADFNKVPEILDVGRHATEAVIPEIKRKLAGV